MARLTRKGITPPPEGLDANLLSFLTNLQMRLPAVYIYVEDLDIASVAATTYSTQTFSVVGLETSNAVVVTPPALTSGLYLLSARVSATDTLSLTFYNSTGSPINEASAEYKIVAIDT